MDNDEINRIKEQLDQLLHDSQNTLTSTSAILEASKTREQELNKIIHTVNAASNDIIALKTQASQSLTDGQEKITLITSISESAKQKEQEINVYNTRILELKTAAESNLTTITDVHNQAQALKQKIEELHASVTVSNQNINQILQESTNKVTELGTYFKNFQDLKAKLDHPDNGLAVTLTKANEVVNQIIKNNEAAVQTKDSILSSKVTSETLLKEVTQVKGNIDANFTESVRLKGEIGKILDLVRDTGLANSFDRRRKRSQNSLLISLGVIIIGVSLSGYLINHVFFTEEGLKLFENIESDYIKFLLRLTLTAPGVFIAWFATTQYTKERYFLEQYEFKTAAALALENYTKLLKQNYVGKEREIFDLNVDLIKSVYKEPEYVKPKSTFITRFKSDKFGVDGKVSTRGNE
jgi:hypothetical protein